MSEGTPQKQPVFARGDEHLDRLLSDPLIASDLTGTGSIVITVHGRRIDLDLRSLREGLSSGHSPNRPNEAAF